MTKKDTVQNSKWEILDKTLKGRDYVGEQRNKAGKDQTRERKGETRHD